MGLVSGAATEILAHPPAVCRRKVGGARLDRQISRWRRRRGAKPPMLSMLSQERTQARLLPCGAQEFPKAPGRQRPPGILRNCAAGAWDKPLATLTDPGGSTTARRSPSLLRTPTSSTSVWLLSRRWPHNQSSRRAWTRTHGGVEGKNRGGPPLSRFADKKAPSRTTFRRDFPRLIPDADEKIHYR
jgi:hypothetical protein